MTPIPNSLYQDMGVMNDGNVIRAIPFEVFLDKGNASKLFQQFWDMGYPGISDRDGRVGEIFPWDLKWNST